jgi:hypothetical protein
MKIIKLLTALLLACNISSASAIISSTTFTETPDKTVVFKDPAAEDASKYFSGNTMFKVWIFKAGSETEMGKIIASLRKDKSVESCERGATTGDYTEMTIVLNKPQNKAWFIEQFKKAGLNHVKINNHPVTETKNM